MQKLLELTQKDPNWRKMTTWQDKGQLNSDEVIVSPKMPTKYFPDFCPERVGNDDLINSFWI